MTQCQKISKQEISDKIPPMPQMSMYIRSNDDNNNNNNNKNSECD